MTDNKKIETIEAEEIIHMGYLNGQLSAIILEKRKEGYFPTKRISVNHFNAIMQHARKVN